jgi:DNA-binding response OmpR family regulator
MPKILCIEDEKLYRETLAEYLAMDGMEVLEATDGYEGIEAIMRSDPDIVLCDINMPGMNGMEMLRKLREQYPEKADTPFIFLTALGSKSEIIEGRMLGCEDYLVKPVDFDILRSTIDARLSNAASRKQRVNDKIWHIHNNTLKWIKYNLQDPLNSINSIVELMQERVKMNNDGTTAEFIYHIHDACCEQIRIINNKIDMISLEIGKLELNIQPLELDSLLWEAINMVNIPREIVIDNINIEASDLIIKADYMLFLRAISGLIEDVINYRNLSNIIKITAEKDEHDNMVISIIEKDTPVNGQRMKLSELSEEIIDRTSFYYRRINFEFGNIVIEEHGGHIEVEIIDNKRMNMFMIFPSSSFTTFS